MPPKARTRLLCRTSCVEAVKWIQRILRLKDLARSIHRVDFSALVLSTVSHAPSDDGRTDDDRNILLEEKACFGDTFISCFKGVLVNS